VAAEKITENSGDYMCVCYDSRKSYAKLGQMLQKNGKDIDEVPAFEREIFISIYQKLARADTGTLPENYAEICMDLLLHAWKNSIRLNSGKPESWAAGLLHVASRNGHVHRGTTGTRLNYGDISRIFGVSCMTVSNQSRKILQYLNAG